MALAERLTVMHAMSFAFPTKREHEDILIEAGRISGRLKRELAG